MKPFVRTFDSHAEADRFVIAEDMAMTPEARLELAHRISVEFWKLHHPDQQLSSVRENMRVEVRDLTN